MKNANITTLKIIYREDNNSNELTPEYIVTNINNKLYILGCLLLVYKI